MAAPSRIVALARSSVASLVVVAPGRLPADATPIASTTTSSGRRRRSSRARRRSATRCGDGRRPRATRSSRTSCRSPRATACRAGADPVPAAARAVLLVPFVALWGSRTDDQRIFTDPRRGRRRASAGGCSAGCGSDRRSALATTVFFAFGTVFWYTAQNATTWYQAHIVAVGLTMLAVGLALGADRDAADEPSPTPRRAGRTPQSVGPRLAPRWRIDRRQFLAGLLFGLACTARLTDPLRPRSSLFVGPADGGAGAWSAALGAAIPVVAAARLQRRRRPATCSTRHTTTCTSSRRGLHGPRLPRRLGDRGSPLHPPEPRDHVARRRPTIVPGPVPRHPRRRSIDPCAPTPGATRGLFDLDCPLVVPRDIGMSVLLTSPAFLLAIPAVSAARPEPARRRVRRSRSLLDRRSSNLMHFSQGWVQFGYRFSNDFVPFALVLVALGHRRAVDRRRRGPGRCRSRDRPRSSSSVAINAWGVVWGRLLGW